MSDISCMKGAKNTPSYSRHTYDVGLLSGRLTCVGLIPVRQLSQVRLWLSLLAETPELHYRINK